MNILSARCVIAGQSFSGGRTLRLNLQAYIQQKSYSCSVCLGGKFFDGYALAKFLDCDPSFDETFSDSPAEQ